MKPREVRISMSAAVLLAACLLAPPASAHAQDLLGQGDAEIAVPRATSTYGTTADSVQVVYGFDMDASSGTVAVGTAGGARICDTPCALQGGVSLPAGALISRVELDGCDSSPTQTLGFRLFRRESGTAGTAQALMALGTTGVNQVPGCGVFTRNLLAPHTVDNEANVYFVQVLSDTSLNFTAVRVYYRLQVSPAPGTASFPNDVPTSHPFFRFVEALAAAGITGGCETGSYCPDQAVTRGQMAVFLATALGLHFPN